MAVYLFQKCHVVTMFQRFASDFKDGNGFAAHFLNSNPQYPS
jgi:hypothetical protein